MGLNPFLKKKSIAGSMKVQPPGFRSRLPQKARNKGRHQNTGLLCAAQGMLGLLRYRNNLMGFCSDPSGLFLSIIPRLLMSPSSHMSQNRVNCKDNPGTKYLDRSQCAFQSISQPTCVRQASFLDMQGLHI